MVEMSFELNISETLNFFDTRRNGKYSNTVIHLLGEELCAFLFKKYLKEEKYIEAQVLDFPCKQNARIGKQLDRWIKVIFPDSQVILYQTEIKTWNSNGFNGIKLSVNAGCKEINDCGLKRWSQIWKSDNSGFSNSGIDKVLLEMSMPFNIQGKLEVSPLLLHWEPLCNVESSNIKSLICFHQEISGNSKFKNVKIFSASIYLRYLVTNGIQKIELQKRDFPLLFEKISKLNSLISLNKYFKLSS